MGSAVLSNFAINGAINTCCCCSFGGRRPPGLLPFAGKRVTKAKPWWPSGFLWLCWKLRLEVLRALEQEGVSHGGRERGFTPKQPHQYAFCKPGPRLVSLSAARASTRCVTVALSAGGCWQGNNGYWWVLGKCGVGTCIFSGWVVSLCLRGCKPWRVLGLLGNPGGVWLGRAGFWVPVVSFDTAPV